MDNNNDELKAYQRMCRMILAACAVAWLGIAIHAMVGCSTVSGAAGLVRGIAQDIEDMSEGTRERMAR